MEDFVEAFELKSHEGEAREKDSHINGSGPPGELCEFGELFSGQKKRMGCELTLLRNNLGNATKVFDLDDKGQLRKRSAANIYEGEAERVSISDLKDLKELIENLPSSSALCFGTAEKQKARLLTQEALRAGSYPDAIARDREHFSFRKGHRGVLMLDCDAAPRQTCASLAGHRPDHRPDRAALVRNPASLACLLIGLHLHE